jgi:hypothetical protein
VWSTICNGHSSKTSAGLKLDKVKEHCIEQWIKIPLFLALCCSEW